MDKESMEQAGSLQFEADPERCIRCGACVGDCPVNILVIGEERPFVAEGREGDCIGCQHCLCICPTGAASVLGLDPDECYLLSSAEPPSFEQVQRLLAGRRSIRRYRQEDVEPVLIRRLLETAYHAPSGRNERPLSFSVIDNREVMDRLREQTMDGLSALITKEELPAGYEFFVDIVNGWKIYQADVLFRWAPHLVTAAARKNSASPDQDGIIALSHFEMCAQSVGIGTLWNGLAKMAFNLLPEVRSTLKIDDDESICFVMSFGMPEPGYVRASRYPTVPIRVVS
jgi:nitroreductase/NAD-dependent dihydropyrimidine dehydrogenase PreA subunit